MNSAFSSLVDSRRILSTHSHCRSLGLFFVLTLFLAGATTHATVEVYHFLAKWFLNDGLLNPNSSGKKKIIGHFFLHYSRCVLRPRGFSSGSGFCFFPKSVFGRRLKLPKLRNTSEKKVVHLYYRSTRPTPRQSSCRLRRVQQKQQPAPYARLQNNFVVHALRRMGLLARIGSLHFQVYLKQNKLLRPRGGRGSSLLKPPPSEEGRKTQYLHRSRVLAIEVHQQSAAIEVH